MRRGWHGHIAPSRPGLSRSDPLDRGVLIDYPLHYATGLRVQDYSGRNFFGTITGAEWIGTQYGRALRFVRTDSDVLVTPDMEAVITTLGQCTFEVLFRENDTGSDFTNRGLLSGVQTDSGSAQRQFGLYVATSNNRITFSVTAGGTVSNQQVDNLYTTGVWAVAHGVYDGVQTNVYFNGRAVGTPVARTGTLDGYVFGDLPLRMANNGLDVDIAHARFYGRALRPSEVFTRYKILMETAAPQARIWYFPLAKAGGATVFNQNLSATLTPAGALIKQTTTLKAGTLSTAGALTKQTSTAKSGVLTPAGAVIKQTSTALASSLASAGALIKSPTKALSGTLTPTGAETHQATKVLAGTVAPGGELTKQTNRALTATLSPAGALAAVRVLLATLAATLGVSGTLTKQSTKPTDGALSPSGTLVKTPTKAISSVLAPTGGLSALRVLFQSLIGNLTVSGSLTKQTSRALDGTLTSVGGLIKTISRALSSTLSSSGVLTALRTFLVTLAATLSPSGSLTKQTSKSLSGILNPSGDLLKSINKVLSATLTTAGSLTTSRMLSQILAATLTTAGTLTKQTQKVLSGTLTSAGSITRQIHKALSSILSFIGSLVATGGTITAVETEYLESVSRNTVLTSQPRTLTGMSIARYKLNESSSRNVMTTSRSRNRTLGD